MVPTFCYLHRRVPVRIYSGKKVVKIMFVRVLVIARNTSALKLPNDGDEVLFVLITAT